MGLILILVTADQFPFPKNAKRIPPPSDYLLKEILYSKVL